MMSSLTRLLLLSLLFLLSKAAASTDGTKGLEETLVQTLRGQGAPPDNRRHGRVRMSAPVMTEEEQGSRQLPHQYRCSGCVAVAYQKRFSVAEAKLKKGRKLPYVDILEISEDVCENRLKGYGVKSVSGEKFLSGEGLVHDRDPGVMEAGGRWEVRLQALCGQLIELYEEEGIYQQHLSTRDSNLAITLCKKHCTAAEIDELKSTKEEL